MTSTTEPSVEDPTSESLIDHDAIARVRSHTCGCMQRGLHMVNCSAYDVGKLIKAYELLQEDVVRLSEDNRALLHRLNPAPVDRERIIGIIRPSLHHIAADDDARKRERMAHRFSHELADAILSALSAGQQDRNAVVDECLRAIDHIESYDACWFILALEALKSEPREE